MKNTPRIAILLATFNGRDWIEQQMESIFAQTDVDFTVLVSDDGSVDGTLQFLESLAAQRSDVVLLPAAAPTGFSSANFKRLLQEVDLEAFDYFALADQDDIWLPEKLSRACAKLDSEASDGYSSNVEALFPDGRKALVVKAAPQHCHDHYFESPGPGCSFVLNRRLMQRLVPVLNAIDALAGDRLFVYHDWFIYAFARRAGFSWYIDPLPTMLYRQHANNVLGANIGPLQRWRRIKSMRSGWYFDEVRWQYDTLEALSSLMPEGKTTLDADLLRIDSMAARVRFCLKVAPEARRRGRDRFWLSIGVLCGLMR